MFYPENRAFKFNRIYSGVTLRTYNKSFGFRWGGNTSISFFNRTGSVVFTDFHARAFLFVGFQNAFQSTNKE